MFSRKKATSKKQALIAEAQRKAERAASYQSDEFSHLKMTICNHSLLTPVLPKRVASVVELTPEGICYYSTNNQKKGVVVRGRLIYKECSLGEAVYCVEESDEVEDGVYKARASLLPVATEALELTIGQGTLDRLSFMLSGTSQPA